VSGTGAEALRSGRLVLIGMMGSGKSTVGALAARRLGWSHLDTDTCVERATGRSVPEIFAVDGEPAFRSAESDALRRALGEEPVVVSVGGGAVLDPKNRQLIERGSTVVWLRAEVATLAGRIGAGEGRPLLEGRGADALAQLDRARRPLYEALADAVVDVDEKTPEEAADAVVSALGTAAP